MSRLKTLSMMINNHLLEIEKENEELKSRIVLLEAAQNKLMNWWAEELINRRKKRRASE